MTWFRIDDGLHAHMKAVRAGVPAMGLWVLAGSWSSDQLTDGWVPDYIAARLDPDYREHAAALVRSGLWVEDEHDGDKGWRFHQWADHQPSSESVLAKREAARERMRRVRGQRSAGSQDVRANVRENFEESAPNPDPTRPDPTKDKEHPSDVLFGDTPAETAPAKKKRRAPAERGTRLPDDFGISKELRVWAAEEIPGFDIDREFLRFRDYWRSQPGQKGVKTKWDFVFRNWMRRAFDERGPSLPPQNGVVPVQQPRQPALPAGYEPRGTIANFDRREPQRESAQARKFRECLEIGEQLDRQFAENGGRL